MTHDPTTDALKAEIRKLFKYIQRIKHDLASIKHPNASIDHFENVADQLKAIVETTEEATQTIMTASEEIVALKGDLGQMVRYRGAHLQLDRVEDSVNRIFEACAFQDLTGQRISKIVKTINLIESTITSLIDTVGVDDVAPAAEEDVTRVDNGVRLEGPSRVGEGVSQADIDALFD